jgi:hypothetical protein
VKRACPQEGVSGVEGLEESINCLKGTFRVNGTLKEWRRCQRKHYQDMGADPSRFFRHPPVAFSV